jgi:hypothetical protein
VVEHTKTVVISYLIQFSMEYCESGKVAFFQLSGIVMVHMGKHLCWRSAFLYQNLWVLCSVSFQYVDETP